MDNGRIVQGACFSQVARLMGIIVTIKSDMRRFRPEVISLTP
jgi:hypothetical protein